MQFKRTLADFLPFESYGRKIAFIEQTPYRTRKYTHAEVAEGIRRAAAALQAQSLIAGDRVILWGANSARWAMTFYACLLQRIVIVPVDASLSSEFIHKIKALTQAKLLLCDAQQSDWDQLFVDSSRAQVTMKSVP
ncbi:MAG TPA: AMP-binding protein, partial [Acidobacteriota bacterium]